MKAGVFLDYFHFAEFYDTLTKNVQYPLRAKRIDFLVKNYLNTNTAGNLLLDLACGTGSLSEELAKLHYDVIGVDYSPAMLNLAMQKKFTSQLPIQYLCQDMKELDMFGTMDITVCMLDSLNHLENFQEVQQVFQKVSLFAQPGGLFLFDMNTLYKHHEFLNQQTFLYDTENVFCAWENQLIGDTVEMQLTFFARDPETNQYSRSEEYIRETAYPIPKIEQAIQQAGLLLLEEFDADANLLHPERLLPVSEKTERILFLTQKPRKK